LLSVNGGSRTKKERQGTSQEESEKRYKMEFYFRNKRRFVGKTKNFMKRLKKKKRNAIKRVLFLKKTATQSVKKRSDHRFNSYDFLTVKFLSRGPNKFIKQL